MNRAKQKRHQAFIDDIRAVYRKHGLQYQVFQAEPEIRIVEFIDEELSPNTTNGGTEG